MIPFDVEKLQRLMRDHGVDAVLATTRHNVRYLTGGYYLPFHARAPRFGGGQYLSCVGIPRSDVDASFYVGRQDAVMNEQDYLDAFGPFWITHRRWIARHPQMTVAAAETAAGALRDLGLAGGAIAVELSFLPADAFDALRRELPEASFSNATPMLGELRAVKRPAEVETLRRVHRHTAGAIRAALSEGRPEQTTADVAAKVQQRIEASGASFLYVFTNLGPGLLRAPSARPWGYGRPLHIDAGAELDEYTSDVARMGSIGPAPAARKMYDACLGVQERVRREVCAGLPCRDLHRIGTEAIKATAWGARGRFLAHGLGMVSHEPPQVTVESDRRLEPGMVLSIETECLEPDVGHVKLEDTIVVTAAGCEGLGDIEREWCKVAESAPR